MSKKKQKKKRNPLPSGAPKPIRLSQCMIVKNEEKNIEKALSWAKDIVFEQIVVDTGSTDRTVEIAESMGAKIFHFEWINDFSAAKNYAIEQASGRWIAFLDADEYFNEEDTEKLKEILTKITNNPADTKAYKSITCPLYNVNEAGNPSTVFQQRRIFRNLPEIRYVGRIHEGLTDAARYTLETTEIGIIHTGYTTSVYNDTKKAVRNIEILEKVLEEKPDDPNTKCYLADSLHAEGSPENLERAERLYAEAISDRENLHATLKHSAYLHRIDFLSKKGAIEESIELCRNAIEDYPDIPDFYSHLGSVLYDLKRLEEAWEVLKNCEETLKGSMRAVSRSNVITKPIILFMKMLQIARDLDDKRNIVHYSVLCLKENKYKKAVLKLLLEVLTKDENTSNEDIFGLLAKIYDFTSTKDKVTILACAKAAENRDIYEKTIQVFTEEELKMLDIPAYDAASDEQMEQDIKGTDN